MRAIAWIAEPDGDEYKYLDLISYFKDLVNTWGFDLTLCVDNSGTTFVNPTTNGMEVFATWADVIVAYPDASYVCLIPGADNLDAYVEPGGDVIYVLGGDYGESHNFPGTPDDTISVATALEPGVGTWSCMAMSVVAYDLFKRA